MSAEYARRMQIHQARRKGKKSARDEPRPRTGKINASEKKSRIGNFASHGMNDYWKNIAAWERKIISQHSQRVEASRVYLFLILRYWRRQRSVNSSTFFARLQRRQTGYQEIKQLWNCWFLMTFVSFFTNAWLWIFFLRSCIDLQSTEPSFGPKDLIWCLMRTTLAYRQLVTICINLR